jgi:hypothetical protein
MFKANKYCLYDNIKVNPWPYLDKQLDIVGNNLILTILMHAKVKYTL